jgi:hypothetical protein
LICSLPFDTFSGIVSDVSIQLKDEDSFYEMIRECFSRDSRYFALFKHVQCEYLSTKSIQSLICLIDESFDLFSFPIWKSLSRRLSLSVSLDFPTERFPPVSCEYSQTHSGHLDGIISYLTRKHCGHVLDRDVISVTARSIMNPQYYPLRNLADFENRTFFATANTPDSWICYDFKNMLINLTPYTIRICRDSNGYHLRSWILEGSIDCESWVELDRHWNDSSLNSQGAIVTFNVSSSTYYRYIRLRQTGMNSTGTHQLILNAIEFFGLLKAPNHS